MATITITPGESFDPTDAVTSTRLNDLGSPTAALTAASIDTADIADDAVTPALIAGDAVTTPAILDANVTFAKLTDVIDDDTMSTATDTTLATSESIKAYVDTSKTSSFTPSAYTAEESVTLPNGLIMKFGQVTVGTNATVVVSFGSSFSNSVISINATFNQNMGTSGDQVHVSAHTISVDEFKLTNATSSALVGWMAIGY